MKYRLRVVADTARGTGRGAIVNLSDSLAGLLWNECRGGDVYAVERSDSTVWTTLVEFNGSDWSAVFFDCVRVARYAEFANFAMRAA